MGSAHKPQQKVCAGSHVYTDLFVYACREGVQGERGFVCGSKHTTLSPCGSFHPMLLEPAKSIGRRRLLAV